MGNERQTFAAEGATVLTASDDVTFPATRGLRVTNAGNVAVRMAGSGAIAVIPFTAGEFQPIAIIQLRSTSTTATGFIGYT